MFNSRRNTRRNNSSRRQHYRKDQGGMPTDAKLGMVVGVALVITIGIVYYRREMQPAQAAAIPTKGTAVVGQVGLKRPDNGEAISGKLMSNKATEEPGKE